MKKVKQQPSTSTSPNLPSESLQPTFQSTLSRYFFQVPPSPFSPERLTRSTSTSAGATKASTSSPLKRKNPASSSSCPSPLLPRVQPTPPSRPNNKALTRKRPSSSSTTHAPPNRYASLPNHLSDSLSPSLLVLFIGVNPGLRTAALGHAYAHPSNLFWKLLHSSGCTPRRCLPSEAHDLPALYNLGFTNIVSRATKDASELSKQEMDAGVEVLTVKIRKWRPEAVVLVGKGIWESVWRVWYKRGLRKEEFGYGWQRKRWGADGGEGDRDGKGEGAWEGARVFVATTTSGLAAGMTLAEKEAVWKVLGEWVARRREERAGEPRTEGPRTEEAEEQKTEALPTEELKAEEPPCQT